MINQENLFRFRRGDNRIAKVCYSHKMYPSKIARATTRIKRKVKAIKVSKCNSVNILIKKERIPQVDNLFQNLLYPTQIPI